MAGGLPSFAVRNLEHMWTCRLFGHRYRFAADGRAMHWFCQRGCAAGGTKTYETAEQASRYATAFDREDSADIGRRAPLIGMFPLRIARYLRRDNRG